MKYLKLTIIFTFIFVILYFELITIGENIKVSHLWKSIFIAVLAVLILLKLPFLRKQIGTINIPHALYAGYFYALYPLSVCLFIPNFFDGVFLTFQRLFYVIFIHYLAISSVTTEQLKRFLMYSVIFVAVSTIPFQLNLLAPLGEGYDLSILGRLDPGFVGLFQNAHSASLALAVCGLISWILFIQERNKKLQVTYGILTLYLVFVMITTYTRSGIAVLLTGLFCYGMLSKKLARYMLITFISSAIIILLVYNLLDTSILIDRIFGRTLYSQAMSFDLNRASSGRLSFTRSAFEMYKESTFIESLVGIGDTEIRSLMYQKTGWYVFSHNGFINELVANGLLGFLIMLFFFRSIFLDIKNIKDQQIRTMGFSIYAAFLTFVLFQGGEFPLQYLLITPFILLGYKKQDG